MTRVSTSDAYGAIALPRTTVEVIAGMEARAGVVFAGEVVAIHSARHTSQAGSQAGSESERRIAFGQGDDGVVEVVLRVDEAVRGCRTGGTYILREWAGLWMNHPGRYRVGERALWLLHAPNAGGLSSPVDGMMGVAPLVGRGNGQQVDLRWIEARTLRGIEDRSTNVPASVVARAAAGENAISAAAGENAAPQPLAPYPSLMGVLHAMEARRNAVE